MTVRTEAKKATLADFRRLAKGDSMTLYLGNSDRSELTWTHDRMEFDLVYGSFSIDGKDNSPVYCYMENSGYDSMEFESLHSGAHKVDPDDKDYHGTVFLTPPLQSQLPKRWTPSGKPVKKKSLSKKEKGPIEDFGTYLKANGFERTYTAIGGGYCDIAARWGTIWTDGESILGFRVEKIFNGLFAPAHFELTMTDYSHRPMWKMGTHIFTQDFKSAGDAIEAAKAGLASTLRRYETRTT